MNETERDKLMATQEGLLSMQDYVRRLSAMITPADYAAECSKLIDLSTGKVVDTTEKLEVFGRK